MSSPKTIVILFSSSVLVLLFLYAGPGKSLISTANASEPKIDDNLKLELVAKGLNFPTSMAFLGPNDILVMENKNGTIQRIVNGIISQQPLLTVNVTDEVDKCMCGIAIKNIKGSGTHIFLYFTEAEKGEIPGDRLYRYQWINDKLSNPKLLISLPATAGHPERHAGGAILINGNILYLTTGDDNGLHGTLAQNKKGGKQVDGTSGILRMTLDGKPVDPAGILGNSHLLNLYYAYGIRNSYGMDFDPLSGNLWDTENGPSFGDEINLVKLGFNSGWKAEQGMWIVDKGESEGKLAAEEPADLIDFNGKGKHSPPEFTWNKTIGPTALIFLSNDKLGKKYQNDMFVSDVTYGRIYHFDLNEDRTELKLKGSLRDKKSDTDKEKELKNIIFTKIDGGVTDLEISPYDGYVHIVAYGQGKIFRIVPSH